ncbi:MAG: 3D domain-containing protein [Chloroflexota bacterium]
MKILLGILLALVALLRPIGSNAATAHNVWYGCRLHLTPDMSHVKRRVCHTYAMPKTHHSLVGWWKHRQRLSPHVMHSVRFPRFQRTVALAASPAPSGGYQTELSVSAYAPGCGASGAMADGQMPFVGAAAGVYPFGTQISVPGFGEVTVEDRGVGPGYLDLYMSSCQAALAWGRQELEVTVY